MTKRRRRRTRTTIEPMQKTKVRIRTRTRARIRALGVEDMLKVDRVEMDVRVGAIVPCLWLMSMSREEYDGEGRRRRYEDGLT